jgi:hypothetical protein
MRVRKREVIHRIRGERYPGLATETTVLRARQAAGNPHPARRLPW